MEELIRQMEANGIRFHPGASDDEIAETEAVLGISLPPSMATLYRHGNGMVDRHELLPSQDLTEIFASEEEVEAGEYEEIGSFWRLMSLAEVQEMHPHLVEFGWNWEGYICYWTDDESNHMNLASGGRMDGRIRRFSHDGGDSSYLYRSVESFCAAQATTGLIGFPYDEAPGRDYPPTVPWSAEQTEEERAVVASLWEELNAQPYIPYDPAANKVEWDKHWVNRLRIAEVILALTPYEDTETLLPLLDDGSYFIQQFACESLARRGFTPAIPHLITVAQRTIPNSPTTAVEALQRIGTPEAIEGIRFLATAVTDYNVQAMIRRAIQSLNNP